MRRSDTGGRSWEPATVVLSDPTNSSEFDAVLTYEPLGNTLFLVYQAMKVRDLCGPQACRQNIRRSATYGRSWTAPTQLPSVNTTGGGLGSRIWGQKMVSEGSRLAESERGVWFWLKRYSICTPHFFF